MTLGLSTMLIVAAVQVQTGLPSREEAIAQLESQGKAKEAFFVCIYNTNVTPSRKLVEDTDPFFLLDGTNSAASKFSSEVSTEQVFAKCAVAMSDALPTQQKMSVIFDMREYRHWVARRVYIERYPETPTFGKLQKPKRKPGNYGDNTDAVASLLRTVDCAVQRDPVTADWLVRNGNPTEPQLGSEFLSNSSRLVDNYYKCANQFTPTNGVTEIMNNLGGVLADSLLKMPDKQ